MGEGGHNHTPIQRSGADKKGPRTGATNNTHEARKRENRQPMTEKPCSSPADSRGRPQVGPPQPWSKETRELGVPGQACPRTTPSTSRMDKEILIIAVLWLWENYQCQKVMQSALEKWRILCFASFTITIILFHYSDNKGFLWDQRDPVTKSCSINTVFQHYCVISIHFIYQLNPTPGHGGAGACPAVIG